MKKEQGKQEVNLNATTTAPAVNAPVHPTYPKYDLSPRHWEEEAEHPHAPRWRDSAHGRLAIRTFSRGMLGCAFLAVGNRYAQDAMLTYHPEEAPKNFAQIIAKVYDIGAGKPIEKTFNALGFDGKRAVTFRPTRLNYMNKAGTSWSEGRSLGHDVVSNTFDFAAMSIGDSLGRDIAGIFDPNTSLTWLDKEGRINYPQAIKSMAMSTFRTLSYNQGEDWAVAVPYAYFVRGQRNLINKVSPGFGYDSDRGLNGGSFKVNDAGKIIGSYKLEGLLDIQSRFTAYNIGTLMFRETYSEIADMFYKKAETGSIKSPEQIAEAQHHADRPLGEKIADNIKHVARWAARDVVKGTMIMTPSVPLFWMTRVPQSAYRGAFIHPEKGVMTFKSGYRGWPRDIDVVHVNEVNRDANQLRFGNPDKIPFTRESEVAFSRYNGHGEGWDEHIVQATRSTEINPLHTRLNPYAQEHTLADKALNPFGELNNTLRRQTHAPVNVLKNTFGMDTTAWRAKRFADTYLNAALSYTPYFWGKAEFARLWDNAKMDQSIERAIDGATNVNGGEFTAGLHDMWRSLWLKPLADPAMEAKAQERIANDVSPADIFDPLAFEPGRRGAKQPFSERLAQHKQHAVDRMEKFKQDLQPQATSFSQRVESKATPSFLEQEYRREAAQSETFNSPTIH